MAIKNISQKAIKCATLVPEQKFQGGNAVGNINNWELIIGIIGKGI